jgi:phage tail-like protein
MGSQDQEGGNARLSAYYFSIEIDGIESAKFQKCEGLEAETYVYEIEEGGLNTATHKFYGRTRYPNLVLEQGITNNEALFNWYKQSVLEDRKIERKNGSIVLRDTQNKEVKRWNFFKAFPCRWIGPRLEANMGSEFALERIEIAYESLEVDAS